MYFLQKVLCVGPGFSIQEKAPLSSRGPPAKHTLQPVALHGMLVQHLMVA
jgi:hypothetical protein